MSKRLAFGPFMLDPQQRRLQHRDGHEIALTPRLFDALLLLARHAGELLDKDRLMATLWPGLVVEENNLSQVVSGLRRALGDEGAGLIQTVPRRGFRFVGDVRELDADAPVDAAPTPSVAASAGLPRRVWLTTGAAAGVLAAGGGGWAWWRSMQSRPVSVAVLPFVPSAGAPRDELLELGLADGLIARLSTRTYLTLRSPGSVLRLAGQAERAARELGADWIVDGQARRDGVRLWVTARLRRSADGRTAWEQRFEQPDGGLFELQDRIAERIAEQLAAAPSSTRASGEPGGTRSAEAYQLFLTAAWRAQAMHTGSAAKSIDLLHQALAIDPGYAQAWALLAWSHRRRLWRDDALPAEVFDAANAALQRALALAPELAQARAGMAFERYWQQFDWPGAEREFRHALGLNPSEVSARWGLAQMLLTQGRVDEGFAQLRLARELDPLSPVMNTLEAGFLLSGGQLAEARRRLDRALAIAPEHGLALNVLGLLRLAEGEAEAGLQALRRATATTEGARPQAVLAEQLALLGRHDEARALLAALQARARTRYLPPTSLAMVHAALGEAGAALFTPKSTPA
jgi:DNA-binding winged helix-turn-helix (wHTH) protein/TolB-like protein/Tfp pilus assembly protein PilF